jgi:hypothetical protein
MADDINPVLIFWQAPEAALFPTKIIAKVRCVSEALLERERWAGTGPKSIKLGGRVLYRKSDVLAWIALHEEAAIGA